MFLFRADVMLAELATLAPQVLEAVGEALTLAERDLDFTRLDAQAFAQAPAISIDYAVMEKTDRAAVLPADFGWSDLGSWTAVAEIGTADDEGNTGIGDVIFADTRGSFVRADDRLVALLGAEDLVVVDTRDALLVATRGRVQDVRTIVAELEAAGRAEAREFPRVHRPWGNYTRIDAGRRYQVKRIVVDPGARLSLQRHRHRAEHWVVVEGRARVTCGEAVFDLEANQSTYIPLGAAHRLENPGDTPLHLIEVQSGDYLGEDDIERLEDAYGRSGPE
jgi:mannose-1-phosphate guanylyltransferase/mannose-6-phosphate isomerase